MSAAPVTPISTLQGSTSPAGVVRVLWDVSHALDDRSIRGEDPPPATLEWRVWRDEPAGAWLASCTLTRAGQARAIVDRAAVTRRLDEASGVEQFEAGEDLLLCRRGDRLLLARGAVIARLDPRGGRIDRPALVRG